MPKTRKVRMRRTMGPARAPEPAAPPTPETVARLRQDVIGRLLAAGRILPVHAEAAEEIRAVHEAVARGMFPVAQTFSGVGRVSRTYRTRDFLDRMTDRDRALWQRRYLPWTRAVLNDDAPRLSGTRRLRMILEIVVDNVPLRDVERRHRLRHGTAADQVRAALALYLADPAGHAARAA